MNIILLLIPGAITYMTIYRLGGNRNDSVFFKIMKYFAYTGFNALFLWLFMSKTNLLSDAVTDSSTYFLTFRGIDLGIMIACSLLLGILIRLLGNIDIHISIEEDKPGLWSRLSKTKKTIVKSGVVVGLVAFFIIKIFVYPAVSQMIITDHSVEHVDKQKSKFQSQAKVLLDKIRKEVQAQLDNNVSLEAIDSLNYKDVDIIRVYEDNRWNASSEDQKPHAVYMLDGDGTVVYFSYKDKISCITWSGHSDDQAFIQANGGWGNGDGFGWTGPATQ